MDFFFQSIYKEDSEILHQVLELTYLRKVVWIFWTIQNKKKLSYWLTNEINKRRIRLRPTVFIGCVTIIVPMVTLVEGYQLKCTSTKPIFGYSKIRIILSIYWLVAMVPSDGGGWITKELTCEIVALGWVCFDFLARFWALS